MRFPDPRRWSLRHPGWTVSLFLGLTLVFVWGNVCVERGGIIDEDVILHATDPFRVMDRYVGSKAAAGFAGRPAIAFLVTHPLTTARDLLKIRDLTEAVKAQFGDGVMSLSEAPHYRDTGETLYSDAYITPKGVTAPDFDLTVWEHAVTHDPAVSGLLVGRAFTWASVLYYLPANADDIALFRKVVAFLEERTIPAWEWLWKHDIYPKDTTLSVAGWTMGRGLIDQGLNVDMLTLVALGVVLTVPVFWMTLGSLRSAVLCVGVMLLGGFVWTRGSLGLLGIHERVFSLLAYANVIVQGTSFALHKVAAFQERAGTGQGWQQAQVVDSLLATTAGIAVFGFVTLWSFGLKPIRELGIASALGVTWIFLLSVWVLPACHLLIGEKNRSQPRKSSGHTPSWSATARTRLVLPCASLALWLARGKKPLAVLGLVIALFGGTALLFGQGKIRSQTRALEFIRGTLVERAAVFLDQPGNVGFDFVDLFVEPANGGTMYNPQFLSKAWALQHAIHQLPQTREVASILSTLHQIARESFHTDFPDTPDEIQAAFLLIESDLAPTVQEQLYGGGGIRVSVSSASTGDSLAIGQLRDDMLALAARNFPDLSVSVFGNNALYPQVDRYVRAGKITNVFSSQIGVALICGLVLGWRNRTLRTARLSPVWGGLVMSVPLVFATAVLGVVMWAAGIRLDMATASIGALTINAATDFSLYLAMTYQALLVSASPHAALKKALQLEGPIIVADCVLNTLCFCPLITSRFLPVQHLGWMMGVMLLFCAIGALVLMAALLPLCVAQKEPA